MDNMHVVNVFILAAAQRAPFDAFAAGAARGWRSQAEGSGSN